jgi:hypothetical protein
MVPVVRFGSGLLPTIPSGSVLNGLTPPPDPPPDPLPELLRNPAEPG